MNAQQLCDIAYVILLDRLERSVLVERQNAASLIAGGVEDIEVPTLADAFAEFDAALIAEPEPESASARLMRELGIS